MSLSDGAEAIPNGLGAAHPCMDEPHVTCWAHLARDAIDVIGGKGRNKAAQPLFEWKAKPADGDPYYATQYHARRMLYKFLMRRLIDTQRSRSRQISHFLLVDLIATIRDGRLVYTKEDEYDSKYESAFDWDTFSLKGDVSGGIVIPGDYQAFAQYLVDKFQATVSNWRFADILEVKSTAFNADTCLDDVVDPRRVRFGVPNNTNSDEAGHRRLKESLQRLVVGTGRGTIVSKLDKLKTVGEDYGRYERHYIGCSVASPPVYGSPRIPTTIHAEAGHIGMLMLGYNKDTPMMDQSALLFEGTDYEEGEDNARFFVMLRGESELEELWDEAKMRCDSSDPDEMLNTQREIFMEWYNTYQEISNSNLDELEARVSKDMVNYYDELAAKAGLPCWNELDNENDADKSILAMSRTNAIEDLGAWERTFVFLTPVISAKEEEGIKSLEPFRCGWDENANFVYRWTCNCGCCLKKGFCEHVFVMTHVTSDEMVKDDFLRAFISTPIPNTWHTFDLNKKRGKGRPTSRKRK